MTVDELPVYLKAHWPEIRASIVEGRWRPQPVRRVEIPKADGRKRVLGILTVLDRFIQQAIARRRAGDAQRDALDRRLTAAHSEFTKKRR